MRGEPDSRMANLFRTLGDETRLHLVMLLLENDLCVSALASKLQISKPAVSQHLKILREAGLVRGEKRGYWTHYEVEKKTLQEIVRALDHMLEANSLRSSVCLKNHPPNEEEERRPLEMCKDCCQQPEKLKTKPQECTPEQIKECHGDEKEHSCEKEEE